MAGVLTSGQIRVIPRETKTMSCSTVTTFRCCYRTDKHKIAHHRLAQQKPAMAQYIHTYANTTPERIQRVYLRTLLQVATAARSVVGDPLIQAELQLLQNLARRQVSSVSLRTIKH